MASQLLGHVAGAFTGARDASPGAFLRARGGTLFLDEIAEMPVESQATLLRVLEERSVVPVGGTNEVRLDVRVVAATDADLDRLVAEGGFRSALLHRLRSYVVHVPPLRERRDDVGRLIAHFLAEELAAIGEGDHLRYRADNPSWLPADAVAAMAAYGWPGNVRELAHCVRQIVIGSRGRERAQIPAALERLWATPSAEASDSSKPSTTRATDLSDDKLVQTLRDCRWSATEAARVLGLSRTTLYALIERSSSIRKVGDIDDDEILSCLQESDGSIARAAEQLRVSERALRLRLRALNRPHNGRAPKLTEQL
jgi:two-component system nitrogen regulation response regulator GlnG